MIMDREKEREIELESAMYTNCLLLGLDPNVIGLGTSSNGSPRVGLFRHSNPKLGEQLLYFILSSLRGPLQSAKDFDKVWPIFDSAQSRDFRKVVQSIISELESQGALPRSNSRVSSLATCCGPRFVELLWQLSLHALREVHRRTFSTDVASNPLPASLTDVAFQHAATLLPVTKARVALERRRFLKNAEMAVQRQAMWSNLAHEMTAEFRGLCAEEAYLQQELEKLHDLRNKVKSEGDVWDDLVSSSSQNSHLVSKATRLWESILARKSQHEVLASGPIEDLIAHREHRYRISGSALLSAMDQSSQVPSSHSHLVDKEQSDGSYDETDSRGDDRGGRVHQTVDVAEIIRRWTHALQRIHKQSLHMAKANDGEGPDILRSGKDGSASGHAESLAATLSEHQQHLSSFQEGSSEEAAELTSRMSSLQLGKASASPMKLPHLFNLTPNSGKLGNVQKKQTLAAEVNQMESLSVGNSLEQPMSNSHLDNQLQDNDQDYVQNLKRSVREAALFTQSCSSESSRGSHSDSSEHFFLPFSASGYSVPGPERKVSSTRSKRSTTSQMGGPLWNSHTSYGDARSKTSDLPDVLHDFESLSDYDHLNSFLLTAGSNGSLSDGQRSFYDVEDSIGQVFSPPLLTDDTLLSDSYEDLLAPLSETETALMEH
ncbi:AUGMIN subunit 6 [Linum grandiflorum]